MELVWFRLRGFRRFRDAEAHLHGPLLAIVGPNEASMCQQCASKIRNGVITASRDEVDRFSCSSAPPIRVVGMSREACEDCSGLGAGLMGGMTPPTDELP